ncbi:hypothetical protein C4157_15995 [Clostridioides difficile]|nr:hypothetical protein [Clostridioides difficile]EGT4930095.1 hypothetical protein [Clostridioides difficile]MDB3286021.1 hypothetical protein [Clostridioides difficile]MDB3557252.1 hypothetical protein [Clostridioides difficile]PSJ83147.1 hypothetical protein C7R55_12440 [Clostridioides difficile]
MYVICTYLVYHYIVKNSTEMSNLFCYTIVIFITIRINIHKIEVWKLFHILILSILQNFNSFLWTFFHT